MGIMFCLDKYASKLLRYEQKHNFKGSAVQGKLDKNTGNHIFAFKISKALIWIG
jgi:hypothetical protein